MTPLVVMGYGAGAHATVVIDAIEATQRYRIAALVDSDPGRQGGDVLGVSVIGDDRVERLIADEEVRGYFFGLADPTIRRRLDNEISTASPNLEAISVVHPSAAVSPRAELGDGVQLLAGSVVGPAARIGRHATVYHNASVDHHSIVGDYVFVAPGAVVCGDVTIGDGAFIGAGASIMNGLRIGRKACVGLGAAVINDVADGETVVGVPARRIERKAER
jgi:UDP-perosamine 4-acetyltransferase